MTSQTTGSAKDRALGPLGPPSAPDDRSSHGHRQLIGILGLILPVTLWGVASWRRTTGLPQWEPLDSVSSYYYSGAVAIFIGILAALAVFLFTYRGYANKDNRRDRRAATVAGTAAAVVAFFPTSAPLALPAPTWWTEDAGKIHFVAAVILFGAFSYISLFLFTKSNVPKGQGVPTEKRARNKIYVACGLGMVACIAWAGIATFNDVPIFVPEALALEFFAISWLVKGHVDETAVDAGKATLHYAAHPRQLAGKVWGAIRE